MLNLIFNKIKMHNWLFLLIAYLPFGIALNPRAGFDLASLRVFILLFFLVCLVKIYQKRTQFYNLQAIGLFLFLILAGFSLLGAENAFWGIRKMLFFVSIFPLYLLVVVLINDWFKIKKAIKTIFISSGILALIGLIQFLAQFVFSLERVYSFWANSILPIFSGFNLGAMILAYPSWLVNINGQTIMRAFSLFSDPHMLSFYLGLSLPLALYLLKDKLSKIWFGLFFLIFIVLLLSFTRGAYLAIIISFLVIAFLLWYYLKNKKLALLFGLSLLIIILPFSPISDRFYSCFDLAEGSNQGRLEMWQQASQTGLDHLWLGVGLGNYSLGIDSRLDFRNPITAHNLYLDLFSEMGIFTLIIWLIFILGTIGYLFQIVIKDKDENKKYLAVSLIGSLVYFSAHSFFETAVYSPPVLALLMIILGLTSYVTKNN